MINMIIIVFLGFVAIFFGGIYIWFLFNSFYLRKMPNNKRYKKDYIAIILTNRNINDKFVICVSGISLLLKYIKKQNKPYILMKKFDEKKFRKIVYDKNCKELYLVGHGCRHGLKIDDKCFYYCELKDAPKKDFIAQLHCNHLGGKSLADYLAKNVKNSFVPEGRQFLPILKLLKKREICILFLNAIKFLLSKNCRN